MCYAGNIQRLQICCLISTSRSHGLQPGMPARPSPPTLAGGPRLELQGVPNLSQLRRHKHGWRIAQPAWSNLPVGFLELTR
jgi:hypothetical protein